MSEGVEAFVASGPWPQRAVLSALVAIGRRPRGARLLARAPLLEQAASAVLALGRYDAPAVSRSLGWNADAVVARGLELRRAEHRP